MEISLNKAKEKHLKDVDIGESFSWGTMNTIYTKVSNDTYISYTRYNDFIDVIKENISYDSTMVVMLKTKLSFSIVEEEVEKRG